MNDAISQFRSAMQAAQLEPPDSIEADGTLHRFSSNGTRGDDAGWYVLHGDGIPAGAFGCWRTGVFQSWRADIGRKLTPAEEAAHRRKADAIRCARETEEMKRHAEARERAAKLLNDARPEIGAHRYLVSKSIQAHGVRSDGLRLLVPMRDTGGVLHSLQFIDDNGGKRFLTGGRVTGCYFGIGKPNGVLCIAEGFATGASIHEATGHAVAVAFNAGNLKQVALALREKFPELRLIVCADDDYTTNGNPGLTKATEAARAVGGSLAIPEFGEYRPEAATDFNDLNQAQGLEAVRRCIEVAEAPIREDRKAGGNRIGVELLRGSDITPEPVSWLWEGWLASGKLHMLAGAPGTGKTTIALALAATITTGGRWPDRNHAIPGDVLIWSGEDDPKDTLVPRLLACGAKMSRVHFVGRFLDKEGPRPFDPARDMETLLVDVRTLDTMRLVIVDPVVSAVASDSHKNAEVRRSLQPLVDLASQTGAAVLGISHFTKGTAGRDPVERVTGSVAFGALPRVVMAAAKLQEEAAQGGVRLFARAKSNIGPDTGGWKYDLKQVELDGYPGVFASRVVWGEEMEGTAQELLAHAEVVTDSEERSATDEAVGWLRDLLSSAPMKASEAQREARQAGISDKALRRARERLRVKPGKRGFAGGWWWALPSGEDAHAGTEDAQDAPRRGVGIFGGGGHLREATNGRWESEI